MNSDVLPPRLYHDLAELWPLISPPSDYAPEMQMIRQMLDHRLDRSNSSVRPSVLELGAGGGHGLWHLTDDFDCSAVDIAPAMVAHCRELNPSITAHVGDMRSVRLDKLFDAVLIHDAIDYMTTPADARAALATAATHLRPGGLLIVVPTYVSQTFVDHEVAHDHRENDDVELTYFSYVHDPDPSDTMIELVLVYLIRSRDEKKELRIEHDRHQCGLFAIDDWLSMIQDAGFEVHLDADHDQAGTVFVGVR